MDLECCFQTNVEGTRPRRAERTWIGKWCPAIGEIGDGAGVKECSIGRITIVKDIVRTRINLERL